MKGPSWIARILAGSAGWLLLVSGIVAQAPRASGVKPVAATGPAALVNGEPIAFADLEPMVDVLIKEKFRLQPPTETQRKQVRVEVLGMLVNDLLMRQFMRSNGPKVDPAEVDQQFADFCANLEKQKPRRTLGDFCKESGQSEAQVRGNIANMIQWTHYLKNRVTDDDLKRYYQESKDFFDQVAVRASHIVIQAAPAATTSSERQAARDKLLALRAAIVAGKLDFAEAAKKNSMCPSASNGGDIGYFSRKWMLDENFARTAYSLEVGAVSEIVETDFGYHLIKVTDRKEGKPSDFEKMKDEVRDFYIEELRQKILQEQRKNAKIELDLQ